ncbi:uncharacterized protein [Triticum aestivum]|uniref:uncharacterized protein n=1 Tax=Triticum aestivum TaxID=4565 RepID=UPI001D018188|nr:uncharacterized protein LOC123046363 [Triticum aestivum]
MGIFVLLMFLGSYQVALEVDIRWLLMFGLVAWCLNFRCFINLGCFSHPFWVLTLDLEGCSFFVLLLKSCSLFSSSHVLQENHRFFTSKASVTQLCLEHAYLFLHCLCLIFLLISYVIEMCAYLDCSVVLAISRHWPIITVVHVPGALLILNCAC